MYEHQDWTPVVIRSSQVAKQENRHNKMHMEQKNFKN
jgi:hypothetical protein